MAAIQTTLTLKDDITKRLKIIEKRVRSLAKTMDNYNRGIATSTKRVKDLTTQANKIATSADKLANSSKKVDKLNQSLKHTNTSALSAKSGVDSLTRSVKKLAAAYLSMVGIGTILDTADTITGATNKLSTVYKIENPNATDADAKVAVQSQMNDIFASAQRSRSSYTDAIHNVGKMLINAEDAFGGNIDKAIAFNELMAKSYTIGGASDKEQSTSMYQLIQALGSGILAGDELRSVREGAQVAYKYIEEYAQELLNTDESLKDLASRGLITSDIVATAILKNADAINKMFDETQVTFEQTWVMMKDNFIKAFEPVLQKLTTLLNNEDFQEMLASMVSAFVAAANFILNALDWISTKWKELNGLLQKNADIISQVLLPLLGALVMAWITYGVASLVASVIANWQLYLVVIAIVAVLTALIWLVSTFEEAGQIIGGIIGFLVALIWNSIVGVVNFIYGIVVTVYNFIANVVNSFATMFSGGFANFLKGLANFFWSFVEVIFDGIQAIAKLIDAVFGTGIDTAMQNFQDKVNKFLEDEEIKDEVVVLEKLEDKELLDRVDYQDFIEKGVNVGGTLREKLSGAKDWLDNTLATVSDPFGGKNWEEIIKGAVDGSDTGDNIDGIADSIELTKEDLEYLRELAEMEAINRFTTAEIKVDMSNYNTISGENDLDGLVNKLSEKIEEEMAIVAEGTY